MAVSYTVDHRCKRVRAHAAGPVNIADLSTYIASRVRDGVYDYDQLIDFSDAQLEVVSQEVLALVRQSRRNLADKPIPFTSIVANPGSATYGVVRQLSALFGFDGASVHIAEGPDAAERWLNEMRETADRGSEPAGDVT